MVDPELAAGYRAEGWWSDRPLAEHVADNATERPEAAAFVSPAGPADLAGYRAAADEVAAALVTAGLEPGDRVAVVLPDSPSVHVTFLGAERAGLTVVGIGARAGEREIAHLVDRTEAPGARHRAVHRGARAGRPARRAAPGGSTVAPHLVRRPGQRPPGTGPPSTTAGRR